MKEFLIELIFPACLPHLGTTYGALRTVFSSSSIGIDNFKLSREQYASRYNSSTSNYLIRSFFITGSFAIEDGFKQRFMDSINRADVQIFTEDLRNMILSAETDEDVDAVIQALRKSENSWQDEKGNFVFYKV